MKKRVNIALGENVLDYFKDMSRASGQPLSSCIGVVLFEYCQGKKIELKTLSQLSDETMRLIREYLNGA